MLADEGLEFGGKVAGQVSGLTIDCFLLSLRLPSTHPLSSNGAQHLPEMGHESKPPLSSTIH